MLATKTQYVVSVELNSLNLESFMNVTAFPIIISYSLKVITIKSRRKMGGDWKKKIMSKKGQIALTLCFSKYIYKCKAYFFKIQALQILFTFSDIDIL